MRSPSVIVVALAALALSAPALDEYLDRLARMDIVLEEGDVADINLRALAWMREVARVLGPVPAVGGARRRLTRPPA